MSEFVDPPALLLLVAANGLPALLGALRGRRAARAIDGGRVLGDGRPWFGAHKTWQGFAVGVLGAAVCGGLLGAGSVAGAAFGLASLAGDLASAFTKRRLGLASGRAAPLLDQLPEALLPLLLLQGRLGLGAPAIFGTALAFTLLDLAAGAIRARWARSESG